jgi:hypothetical protein
MEYPAWPDAPPLTLGRVLVSARKFRELKVSNASEEIEGTDAIDVVPRALADKAEDKTD